MWGFVVRSKRNCYGKQGIQPLPVFDQHVVFAFDELLTTNEQGTNEHWKGTFLSNIRNASFNF
jgi:hypothetical protein